MSKVLQYKFRNFLQSISLSFLYRNNLTLLDMKLGRERREGLPRRDETAPLTVDGYQEEISSMS